MTLLIILVIVIPFTLLMTSLANEVIGAYNAVEEMIKTGRLQAYLEELRKVPAVQTIWARLDQSVGLSQSQPFDFLLKNIQQISTFLFNQSSKILKGLSTFLFSFFFTLLSLYFLFKDGDRLFLRVKEVLPVPPKERDLLIGRFQAMVKATVFGGILIAIIQGVLGGLAYWVLGLHSPVLWGTAMAFFSFIPVGGTALIWGPTCLILFIQGHLSGRDPPAADRSPRDRNGGQFSQALLYQLKNEHPPSPALLRRAGRNPGLRIDRGGGRPPGRNRLSHAVRDLRPGHPCEGRFRDGAPSLIHIVFVLPSCHALK